MALSRHMYFPLNAPFQFNAPHLNCRNATCSIAQLLTAGYSRFRIFAVTACTQISKIF
jgi:hypothetical protein